MPQIVISDFSAGMMTRDKNIPNNAFNVGDGLDIHSNYGYILPTVLPSKLQDTTGSVLLGIPINMAIDPVSFNGGYIIDNLGNMYHVSDIGADTFDNNFHGSGGYFVSLDAGWNLVDYNDVGMAVFDESSDGHCLFFTYNTSDHGYLGKYVIGSPGSFSKASLGTALTNYSSPHPLLEWENILFIGNGEYLGTLDSSNNFDATALDLGAQWVISALFKTPNYLGVCAWKKSFKSNSSVDAYTESRIFFVTAAGGYNALSIIYQIPVKDVIITGAINVNGNIIITSYGANKSAGLIGALNSNNGIDTLFKLNNISVGGNMTPMATWFPQQLAPVADGIWLATGAGTNNVNNSGANILSLRNELSSDPLALSFPLKMSTNTSDFVTFIKQVSNNKVYIGWKNNAIVSPFGQLSKVDFTSAAYGTALYKPAYYDFPQKAKLNYVKFYYKPLNLADSNTPTIDIDYGTSLSLVDRRGNTTISYANDFRNTSDPNNSNTSKRFDLKGQVCHAVRPCLNQTAGSTQFSKIVIDYDLIADDN